MTKQMSMNAVNRARGAIQSLLELAEVLNVDSDRLFILEIKGMVKRLENEIKKKHRSELC